MFIKVTQSGSRRYAQLVESFRNQEGKPRQRTVCTLGRLEAGGEVDTLIASLQRARGVAPAASNASALDGLRFTDSPGLAPARHPGRVAPILQTTSGAQTCAPHVPVRTPLETPPAIPK